jgi:hypothetical protein
MMRNYISWKRSCSYLQLQTFIFLLLVLNYNPLQSDLADFSIVKTTS